MITPQEQRKLAGVLARILDRLKTVSIAAPTQERRRVLKEVMADEPFIQELMDASGWDRDVVADLFRTALRF